MKYLPLKPTLCCLGITLLLVSNLQGQSTQKEYEETLAPSVEKLFAKMDANEDGLLSKEEFKGPLRKDFSNIDLNSDGFISEEELKNSSNKTKKAFRKKVQ